MGTIYILVGLQASGKSAFQAYHSKLKDLPVVSKDRMSGTGKQRKQTSQLLDYMTAGKDVVVDNTNVSNEDRAPVIRLARALGYRVEVYLFRPDVAGSLARNRQRTGKSRVPDVAIHSTYKRFVTPTYNEGVDVIRTVSYSGVDGELFKVEPYGDPSGPAGWAESDWSERWAQVCDGSPDDFLMGEAELASVKRGVVIAGIPPGLATTRRLVQTIEHLQARVAELEKKTAKSRGRKT